MENNILFYAGFACVGGIIVIVLITTITYYCVDISIRSALKSREERDK